MKIGILTQPLGRNYGGVLQNWALQQVLADMGHEPVTLRLRELPRRKSLYYAVDAELRYYLKKIFRLPAHDVEIRQRKLLLPYQEIMRFVDNRVATTKWLDGPTENELSAYSFDAYVVGSDQVWRPIYNRNNMEAMFCSFLSADNPAGRVAYAASFGVDEWEYSDTQTRKIADWLSCFSAVSVREQSGVNLCKIHLGIDVTHVFDPALLLDSDRYIGLINEYPECKLPEKPFAAVYILDGNESVSRKVNNLCMALNLERYDIGSRRDGKYPSVENWLAGISGASYVITDSFHGTAFSLIFHKPFVILENSTRGNDRILSLLNAVGAKDRLIGGDVIELPVSATTDWDAITAKMSSWRKRSVDFLKNALK